MSFDKKNDCVVITGAAGFVGGRALYKLSRDGYAHIVATDVCKPDFEMPKNVQFETMDITSRDSIESFLSNHKPKAIINIAAVFNFAAPWELLNKVNVEGPASLLDAGKRHGLEHLVQISSGTVYENNRMLTEDSPLCPIEPYGKSKLEMERKLAGHSGTRITILRPAVIYGPQFPSGSRYGAALAMFAQYMLAKLFMGLTGHPYGGADNEACYVHVDDVIGAQEFTLEKELSGTFNIVDQTPVTHRQLGQIVLEAMKLPWYWSLLKGKSIPLPEKPMKKFGKIYKKASPVLRKLGITLPLDEGSFTYMFGGNFSMNPAKLMSHGFTHEHPSAFKSMPPVVREYIDSNWEILVGKKPAKILSML